MKANQVFGVLLACSSAVLCADTVDHYMHIVTSIPTMEMKADVEAQAWARSARNVLVITNESIAETLIEANRVAQVQGRPLFCLPSEATLDAQSLRQLMEEAYHALPGSQVEKDHMTVSQLAWLAITKRYPCHQSQQASVSPVLAPPAVVAMQHAGA